MYIIHTPNQYNYERAIFLPKDDVFVINVKASSDAHILLSTVPGGALQMAYEVVIGGWTNTMSVIKINNQVYNNAFPTLYFIVCFQFKTRHVYTSHCLFHTALFIFSHTYSCRTDSKNILNHKVYIPPQKLKMITRRWHITFICM